MLNGKPTLESSIGAFVFWGLIVASTAWAQSSDGTLRVSLRPAARQVPVGQPVLVHFLIENVSQEAVTLVVPGTEPDLPDPAIGLPLTHIFSNSSQPSISVTTESGRRWDQPHGFRKPGEAPILVLAPQSSVGTTLDLREYFPALRGAGHYRMTWQPYGGTIGSSSAWVLLAPLKQVEITTDQGVLTVQLTYSEAPETVADFLELAESGFYTGKTFHRTIPGVIIQGGCPRGDGTGIRPDGKRVPAESNHLTHKKGTLSMALLGDDPNSASCQFFICNTNKPEWDGLYTVFGQLVGEESYKTLDKLMAIPTDDNGYPQVPIIMRSVRVTDASTVPEN